MKGQHIDPPSDDLLKFAIAETFGERCDQVDPDCYACRAWAKYDAVTELVEALEACQASLALMIEPKAIKSSTVMGAFTQAFEADCKARSALAHYRELAGTSNG